MELNARSSRLAREEQQGRSEKIVTSRNADKLRTTAADAIIITRAIELHLDRSHGLGSPAVPGRVCLFEKPDGRTRPSVHHPHHPSCLYPHLQSPRALSPVLAQTFRCCASTYCAVCSRWWLTHTHETQIQMFFYLLKQPLGQDLLTSSLQPRE